MFNLDNNSLLRILTILGSIVGDQKEYSRTPKPEYLMEDVGKNTSDVFNYIGLGWNQQYPSEFVQHLRKLQIDDLEDYENFVDSKFGGSKILANQNLRNQLKNIKSNSNNVNPEYTIRNTMIDDAKDDFMDGSIMSFVGDIGGRVMQKSKNQRHQEWKQRRQNKFQPYRHTVSYSPIQYLSSETYDED